MNETKLEEVLPSEPLKLSQGILYGIGCGIGGAIFILLGSGIQIAGSGILISLLLGGILIFFTGLNFAELSTSLPLEGGAYNFSKEGLGRFLAFTIGFFLWIANTATCAFSAQTLALVFKEIFMKLNISINNIFIILIAILTILLTCIVVYRTQKIAIKALLFLTNLLIVMLVFFVFSSLLIAPFTNTSNYNPNFIFTNIEFIGILPAFLILFLLFTPIITNLAYFNSGIKNPSKSIPKTYIFAIILTLIIYLLITFVVLINIGVNPSNLVGTPVLLADVFESVLGPFGFYFMAIAIIISTLIAINAGIGSAVSVIKALARDHFIPKKFGESKKSTGMPVLALLITASFAVLFTIFASIGLTGAVTNFVFFVGLAFVNYAAVKLRRKRKELDRPFKAPFFPVLPYFIFICFLVFAVILGIIISIEALVLGVIMLVIVIAYYLLTIADNPSIVLTVSGIKFFFFLILAFFIWMINNFSVVTPDLVQINRILIGICIFVIGTIFLDLIPLKELAYFYVKKVDKEKVAINIGNAQIIDLGKKRIKVIYFTNLVIAIIQFISTGIIFFIIYLLFNNLILIQDIIIDIGTSITYIPSIAGISIYISVLIFFGLILFFSGLLLWHRNRELKSLGI